MTRPRLVAYTEYKSSYAFLAKDPTFQVEDETAFSLKGELFLGREHLPTIRKRLAAI